MDAEDFRKTADILRKKPIDTTPHPNEIKNTPTKPLTCSEPLCTQKLYQRFDEQKELWYWACPSHGLERYIGPEKEVSNG